MPTITLRQFNASDSLDDLTDLLHRAYAAHAAAGRRFFASYQSPADTARRIGKGECWLLLLDGAIVGTVTLIPQYEPPTGYPVGPPAGSFSQLAIVPEHVGQGLGHRLLMQVEGRLRELGVTTAVIDTSCLATDLIGWYERRGYVRAGTWRWSVTNYQSVVLRKRITPDRRDGPAT